MKFWFSVIGVPALLILALMLFFAWIEAPAREACEQGGNVWLSREAKCVGAPR